MATNPATLPLTASKEFDVRFSEVDAMNVVWHGAYPLYFEDAREAFGTREWQERWGILDFPDKL